MTQESKPLKQGTVKCPVCKEKLWFETLGTMRIIRNGVYEAYCPKEKIYFNVKAPTNDK